MTNEEKFADWDKLLEWWDLLHLDGSYSLDVYDYLVNVKHLGFRAPNVEFNPENGAVILIWSYVDIVDKYYDIAFFHDGKCGWYYRDGDKVDGRFEQQDYVYADKVHNSFQFLHDGNFTLHEHSMGISHRQVV